jgi:uncharacterized integral membrane protein
VSSNAPTRPLFAAITDSFPRGPLPMRRGAVTVVYSGQTAHGRDPEVLMSYVDPRADQQPARRRVNGRAIFGLVIALLVIGFIALNRDQTTINFLFFEAQLALWVVLAIVAALGFIAGFLIGRKRYKA